MPDTVLGRRTLLSGKIVWNYGQSTIDCVVRSLSDTGACVQVESTHEMPNEFQLAMQGGRERKACKVLWQSDNRVGVAFIGSAGCGNRPRAARTWCAARCWPCAPRSTRSTSASCCSIRSLRAQFINKAFRRMWKLAGREGRRESAVRRLDVSRPRHACLPNPGRRARRLRRRARRTRAGRRRAADRSSPQRRTGAALSVRDAAQWRAASHLHVCYRHRAARRPLAGADGSAAQRRGRRDAVRRRTQA